MVKAKVALVSGESRKGNVLRALEMVREDVESKVKGRVMIKPNFLSTTKQIASTHVDAVRSVLNFVSPLSPEDMIVAEGAPVDTWQGFENFGYIKLLNDFPVRLVDLNDETSWENMDLIDVDGRRLTARINRTAVDCDCRISVALPKTHDTATVTLTLKNMMGCVALEDRIKMHGHGSSLIRGKLYRPAVSVMSPRMIEAALHIYQRVISRRRTYNANMIEGCNMSFVKSVKAITYNLAALVKYLAPHIAVIDGYTGMEGRGPGGGEEVFLGIAIASSDFLAADAVAAKVMGFEPMEIGYIRYIHELGLGIADMNDIEVIGEDIGDVRKEFKPHPNYPEQKLWDVAIPGTLNVSDII